MELWPGSSPVIDFTPKNSFLWIKVTYFEVKQSFPACLDALAVYKNGWFEK